MSAIGEQLVAVKKNYDMIKFKTVLRATDAKDSHPLLDDANVNQDVLGKDSEICGGRN